MSTKFRRKQQEERKGPIHYVGVAMIVFTAVGAVIGTVWGASEYVQTLATKNDLVTVSTQAQTALELQMEDIMARIAHLKAKPRKTQEDRDQIKYLEEQLDRVRKMRAIK